MKKQYSQVWLRYIVKLLRGVPFPPEPMPEPTEQQRNEARRALAFLISTAMYDHHLFYRI